MHITISQVDIREDLFIVDNENIGNMLNNKSCGLKTHGIFSA